jgi:hypothetical protein
MADTKITDLASGDPVVAADEFVINRAGVDNKVTIDVLDFPLTVAALTVTGTADVTGLLTANGSLKVNGTLTVSGTVAACGAMTVAGTLTTSGLAVLANATVSGTLTVGGTITSGTGGFIVTGTRRGLLGTITYITTTGQSFAKADGSSYHFIQL